MRTPFRWTLLVSMISFVSLFALTGCDDDDNPASSEEEDHLEAFGVRILDSWEVKATVQPGDNGAEVTGLLWAIVDGRMVYTVEFLDADGNWFDPAEEHGHQGEADQEEHALEVREGDAGRLTITDHEDTPTLLDEWEFGLEGSAGGVTEIRIVVLHNGHDDYVSAWIPVMITDPRS